MKALNTMKLQFESRSVNEAFARTAVSAFIAQLDPTLDELADVKTAVSEAVTNCTVHAYGNSIGPVYITASIREGSRVLIKVRDTGCGIEDVKKAMEPLYTSRPGAERAGLGFAVMQSLMDRVRVRSHPGAGTTVTLEKRITSKGVADGK
jgi:stage II sporulation protein AB (anti-sigma F factor)